jgi:hypothetical protein
MVKKLFWLPAIAMFVATPVAAQSLIGFQTPSGNIHCLLAEGYLRCDLRSNIASVPRRPSDCDLEWGDAFNMTSRSRASRLCHGDTAMNPENPVLGYGRTWRQGGFVCRSATSGLTCSNQSGHGWQLSRERQRIF